MRPIIIMNIITLLLTTIFMFFQAFRAERMDINNGEYMPFADCNIISNGTNKEILDSFLDNMERLKTRVIWRYVYIISYIVSLLLFFVLLAVEKSAVSSSFVAIEIPWFLVFIVVYFVIYQVINFYQIHDKKFIYNNMIKMAECLGK